MSIAMKRNELTFFDKVIHVTFYCWQHDPDAKLAVLTQALAIRSDSPGPGFKYFQKIQPPSYNTARKERILYTGTGISNMANEDDYLAQPVRHYGMKPAMRLQLQQLPETVCTNINLTIENLDLELDISSFTAMYIEAGYAHSNGKVELMSRFHASIFTSYIETPNPNGRTVFTGIVGNWFVKGLRAQPYVLVVEKTDYTIEEIVSTICSFVGIIPVINVPPGVSSYTIGWSKSTLDRAQSAYQVVDWLAKQLMSLTRQMRIDNVIGPEDILCAYFHDNIFYVSIANRGSPDDKEKVAINLNKVSNASFEGGKLTITAPWNPKMIPGQLFYMSPVYFKGRMVPNVALVKGLIRDEADLYRAITIDVTFENVGTTNSMKIMAVKANLDDWNAGLIKNDKEDAGTRAGTPDAVEKLANQTMEFRDDNNQIINKNQREIADLFKSESQREQAGTELASFYAGEDPYAVGFFALAEEGSDAWVEREYRRAEGAKLNWKKGNDDVVITLDRRTVDEWKHLINPNTPPRNTTSKVRKFDERKDSTRLPEFYNKVDDSKWIDVPLTSTVTNKNGSVFTQYNDFGTQWVGMQVAGVEAGALPAGSTVRKNKRLLWEDWEQKGWDWIWPGTNIYSRGIQIRDICSVLSPLASYKTFLDNNGGRIKWQDIAAADHTMWAGSIIHLMQGSDLAEWPADWQARFPSPSALSGYENVKLPKITTGAELSALLDDHIDYLIAVRDYLGEMGSSAVRANGLKKGDKLGGAIPALLYDLTCLITWHQLYPKTPWEIMNDETHTWETWE